jgi:hypothetical protein
MIDALTTIQIHGSAEWKAWLGAMLVHNPNGLGSELVETLKGTDNVARADTLLAAATSLGWIERTGYAPSDEQRFFGVGGVSGSALETSKASSVRDFHGQLYLYRVSDRAAVEAHVGADKPKAQRFELGDVVKYNPAFVAQIQGGASMRKARGRVVGYAFNGTRPRVSWDDDPTTEPACQAPVEEPPVCVTNAGLRLCACACPRVPYVARAVSPSAIQKTTQ